MADTLTGDNHRSLTVTFFPSHTSFQVLDMLEDIVVNKVGIRIGEAALEQTSKKPVQVTAGILCADHHHVRAGVSCFDVKRNSDVLVAKLVGQGNEGAKLEGTDWTINLRYSVSWL